MVENTSQHRKKHVFVAPFCPKIIIESHRKGSNVKIWVMVEEVYEVRGIDGKKAKRTKLLGSVEI